MDMNKISVILISMFLVAFAGLGVSHAEQFGIVTGSDTGTYFQIGKDLSGLMKREKLRLLPNSAMRLLMSCRTG